MTTHRLEKDVASFCMAANTCDTHLGGGRIEAQSD